MHESARTFHNLEIPTPATVLAPGWHRFRGWVLPKGGGHFVDVRLWVQGQLFPAVHGIPRPDLAAFFKTRLPYALAEFTAVVQLAPGPAEIVCEALDLEGSWCEFARATHRVDPALPPTDLAAPGGSFRWHDFCRGLDVVLRMRRTQPQAGWPEIAQRFAAAVPYPRDLHTPELPFIGFLDEPAAVNRCWFGRVPVIGHVFHTGAAIQAMFASADLQVLQPLECGRPLPHVGAFYPQHPTAAASGYLGFVDVPAQLPNPAAIRIYAALADGSLHLVSALRTRLYDADEEKFAYAAHDTGDFDAALAAWRQALAARGIPVITDGDFQPALDRLRENYSHQVSRLSAGEEIPPLAATATVAAALPAPRRILLVTHNLNAEGAPLFLLDLAGHYANSGIAVTVLSPVEGPLRQAFEAAGATIALLDVSAVFAAADLSAAKAFDFRAFDLVVGNTFTTFWAVHAAKQAGRPVLLYIHESTTPAGFYRERYAPAVIALAEEALRLATVVSFTTSATRRYHLDYSRPASHRLTPGWIYVGHLDRWRAQNPRETLRAKFRLQPGELLVTNIGTVCERKGQHIFARAVDLLWRSHPNLAARTRFVMLGGGQSTFDASLAELLVALDRPNLVVHPATLDYLPYYAAADLFVCSTYEESSPRVILEAMACGTPILSSAVHGIPEQVRDGREARLVPAGDTTALAAALAELLAEPARGAALAAAARARVVAEFDAKVLLPRHLALACELAAGGR
jgi:glycosyltransferase involved in cell wall biosynthesis